MILSPFSGENLLSFVQSIELVPLSGPSLMKIDYITVMLGVKGFDFSSIHESSNRTTYPSRGWGRSLDRPDSAANAMSKLGTLFPPSELSLLLSTGSSDCVRIYTDKLRTNFSDP
jgi:hypothetical protein